MKDQKQTKLTNKTDRMWRTKTFRTKDQNQLRPTKDQTYRRTICSTKILTLKTILTRTSRRKEITLKRKHPMRTKKSAKKV